MDADSSLDHVFFPNSGVISVVAVYADGSIIEMATIGREGCSGVQAALGAKSSSARLLVQIPGSAAKMSRAAFTRAMESMPSFRGLMYAYSQAFLEQVMVSVACNGDSCAALLNGDETTISRAKGSINGAPFIGVGLDNGWRKDDQRRKHR